MWKKFKKYKVEHAKFFFNFLNSNFRVKDLFEHAKLI